VCDISEKVTHVNQKKNYIKSLLGMATGTERGGRRDDDIKLYVRGRT